MPLIEIVDEDYDEKEERSEIDKDASESDADIGSTKDADIHENARTTHPSSWVKDRKRLVPDYKCDPPSGHPGAAFALERDSKVAAAVKERGNRAFKEKRYEDAIELFTEAIARVPLVAEEDEAAASCRRNLAVYYSNRAACKFQLKRYEGAVSDCDAAIDRDPKYVKAIMRRSKAKERLDRLEDALDDMKLVVEIAPTFLKAAMEHRRLDAAVKKKHEEMKTEVLGKLKDLGNSILGNFGMSLDNFKAVQDPATGSYSISYGQ